MVRVVCPNTVSWNHYYSSDSIVKYGRPLQFADNVNLIILFVQMIPIIRSAAPKEGLVVVASLVKLSNVAMANEMSLIYTSCCVDGNQLKIL